MGKLDILGRGTQTTHVWVKQAGEELKWADERRAFLALRAVLHALRDRLTIEEAVQLGAQLPTFVRGCYYDGWKPKKKPVRDPTRYGFLGEIQTAFRKTHDSRVDSVHVARAVFRFLNRKISEGEINDVRCTLPPAVRDLWPEAAPRKKNIKGRIEQKKRAAPAEKHPVEELIRAAEEGDRAVLGLSGTLQALNSGRTWELIYVAGTPLSGCECPRCAGLFPAGSETCRYCGSAVRFVRNMTRRIRERAGELGIKVEVVRSRGLNVLSDAGGIGVFLKTTRAAKLGLE
jgi:uncharacterized protein (DUF2267 family)